MYDKIGWLAYNVRLKKKYAKKSTPNKKYAKKKYA